MDYLERGFRHLNIARCCLNKLTTSSLVQFANNEVRLLWQLTPQVLCHPISHNTQADKAIGLDCRLLDFRRHG